MQAKLLAYLRGKACVDCGNTNVVVFEFDHVRGEKRADISKLLKLRSWAPVAREMAKCDIVCANCHRIRTARRNADYRAKHTGLVAGGQLELAV